MHYSDIFMFPWTETSHCRIPSLIVTKRGTVLVFCNNRKDSPQDHAEEVDIVFARKELFGEWEEIRTLVTNKGWQCGIGSAVYDPISDTAGCSFHRNPISTREWKEYTKEEREEIEREAAEKARRDGIERGHYMLFSTDDGKTWQDRPFSPKPASVLHTDGEYHTVSSGCHGSSHGIMLKKGKYAGRLVCPSRFSIGAYSTFEEIRHHAYNNCIYSDDRGESWQTSAPVQIGTGEGTLIECEDGSLLYNSRAYFADGRRRLARSYDGGETWTDFSVDEFLLEETTLGCNASMIRVERESFPDAEKFFPEDAKAITVFVNPRSEKRENLTASVSFDDGVTWSHLKTIWAGSAGYSSLEFCPLDRRFHIMFERCQKNPNVCGVAVGEFDLEWLMS